MSNQIEELQKLSANTQTYKIPVDPKEGETQAEIKLYPLAIDEMTAFAKKQDITEEDDMDSSIDLISKSMGIHIDEAKKIPVRYLAEIIECIMSVNNMSEDSKQGKQIQEFIKQKQDLIKNNDTDTTTRTTEE